jgi:hypothetical protein
MLRLWAVMTALVPEMATLTARLSCAATVPGMTSVRTWPPAGMVTVVWPEKVARRFDPATRSAESADVGVPTQTLDSSRGAVPEKFDSRTRTSLPPRVRLTMFRTVMSVRLPPALSLLVPQAVTVCVFAAVTGLWARPASAGVAAPSPSATAAARPVATSLRRTGVSRFMVSPSRPCEVVAARGRSPHHSGSGSR